MVYSLEVKKKQKTPAKHSNTTPTPCFESSSLLRSGRSIHNNTDFFYCRVLDVEPESDEDESSGEGSYARPL